MPEKKRTFKADVHEVYALELQPRRTKDEKRKTEVGSFSSPEDDPFARIGYALSRETILRLIDRLKDK